MTVAVSTVAMEDDGEIVKGPFPKPFAVRDCPPFMRIKGGRPMQPIQLDAKPIVQKKPKRRFQDPVVTVLSDLESQEGVPWHHSAKCLLQKKAGVLPTKLKKVRGWNLVAVRNNNLLFSTLKAKL